MKRFVLFLVLVMASAMCQAKDPLGSFCSWDHPGAHKYEPYPSKALDDYYMDFQVRAALKAKMEAHQYDDVVTITRDGIKGYKNLREMHYGRGMVCPGRVDTSRWAASHTERALVYCERGTCVAVPTVCNNVSLIDREEEGEPIGISPGAGNPNGNPQPGGDASPNEPGRVLPENPGGEVVPGVPEETSGSDAGPSDGCDYSYGGGGGYGGDGGDGGGIFPPGYGGGSPGCGCVPPPPTCAVPEPSAWIMILAGVVCFWYRWRTRDKRRD